MVPNGSRRPRSVRQKVPRCRPATHYYMSPHTSYTMGYGVERRNAGRDAGDRAGRVPSTPAFHSRKIRLP